MMNSRNRSGWVFWASLLVAFLLSVIPVAPVLQPFRPAWVALVLAYWVIETPDKVSIGFAFCIGLIGDVVMGSMLGENALRMVVMTFLLHRFRNRIGFFPLSQQALVIGALLLNDKIIVYALRLFWGLQMPSAWTWVTPLIGFAIWPLLFLALDSLRLNNWRR